VENPAIGNNFHWYPLYTKPRHEFKAEEQLKGCGVEFFLPKVTRVKQWSDRKKKVIEPLFSGYIFVRGNERERLLALEQYAIVRSIFFEGAPAIVPDWQIENLQKMLESGTDVEVSDRMQVGTTVKIISGPFKDVEGVIYELPNQERMLAITIDLLRRSVVVKIPTDSIIEQKG